MIVISDKDMQLLINSLSAIAHRAEQDYHHNRAFIDNQVPNWTRGDDGPSYPFLNLAKQIRVVENKLRSLSK